MKFVMVKSYSNGKDTGVVFLRAGNAGDHTKTLEQFRAVYPEHKDCILVASTIDSDNPRYAELIDVCLFR